ncbi:MAG: YncE family protein [Acidobacteriales bacterium]|nr:YncE family protein [Terriglobales bacterium]
MYSANQGNGTVTSFNTIDMTVASIIPTGPKPIWVVARADSQRIYALDQGSGTISVIDTATDTVIGTLATNLTPNFMFYDPALGRIYVTGTNGSGGGVSIFDASTDPPTNLTPSPVVISPTIQQCGSAPVVPVSIAVLRDGTQAYVAGYQIAGGTICGQVSVINTTGNTVSATIPIGSSLIDTINNTGCASARFRLSVAAAADRSKVYAGFCDGGDIAVISAVPLSGSPDPPNSLITTLPAPISAFPALPGNTVPPNQNPVFVFAGP